MEAKIGVVGGSGLYEMEGFTDVSEITVTTPFGEPSDPYMVGLLQGRRVAFLPRHGKGHRYLPHEINYRANIYGFKKLGVERIISLTAVGSMRQDIKPMDLVLVNQFFDRTKGRLCTFFGEGIAAHISFDKPTCDDLSAYVFEACQEVGVTVHRGGTYICMEGPQFSTLAESLIYRKWGVDVIGMTNLTESKLAREAEMCYSTLALVTDYDCWRESEEAVSVGTILDYLRTNAENAKKIVKKLVPKIPETQSCACKEALAHAIITDPSAIPQTKKEELSLIIGKYIT
ncbi:S-methyl-5'-thioadenosine phosphorylase [candidate division CSSED10-310 bacterium]|uniref:S-methyl-5'-thioadenosine phosphorylase n=1 Tax=candidate division CSSED10-310 bacterium TaxID=2855610 RepID=A0ABV6Z2U7_UNCC1